METMTVNNKTLYSRRSMRVAILLGGAASAVGIVSGMLVPFFRPVSNIVLWPGAWLTEVVLPLGKESDMFLPVLIPGTWLFWSAVAYLCLICVEWTRRAS
jgi:hypothetical protein